MTFGTTLVHMVIGNRGMSQLFFTFASKLGPPARLRRTKLLRLLTTLAVEPDGDIPAGSTRRSSQFALVLVVSTVAPTHRPRFSVVAVDRTPRRTLTVGGASVYRGDTPGPVLTLHITAGVRHLCGEDVATCAQFA